MPISRRHALQALGLAVAGRTAMGKAWGKEAETLRQELEACSPGGDPWTALLERNRVFSKAWQRSIQAKNPQERMQIKQAIFDESCHINPKALAQGQRPWAAPLSCADARVAPEWMFGALEVPLIVVMGHSRSAHRCNPTTTSPRPSKAMRATRPHNW